MNAGKSPSLLATILGKPELVSELEEVIELCLGVMVEEQKITQTKYDEVAKFFQDRMQLHINPASVATPSASPSSLKKEQEPTHTPAIKEEAAKLRHKIKHTKSKEPSVVEEELVLEEESVLDTSGSPNPPMNEQIEQARKEGKYPAKGSGGKEFKAPEYFEFKGVKWTVPDWAKKKQKSFNNFKHQVIHGKWRGTEYPTPNKKDEAKIFKKDTATHNLPTNVPTKEQRKAIRNAARSGEIGKDRTLPTGPKVQEMLNKGKSKSDEPNLQHQHGYVNHTIIEEEENPLIIPDDELAA